MNIKSAGLAILSLFSSIRVLPLYLLWKCRLLCGDKECEKFKKDLLRAKCGFWITMYMKPQYKELLYARLGYWSFVVKWICGRYPVTIDSRNNMCLGSGVWMEHPHGSHLHAKAIGKNLTIKHNVTIGMNNNSLPTIGDNVFCGVGACILGGYILETM